MFIQYPTKPSLSFLSAFVVKYEEGVSKSLHFMLGCLQMGWNYFTRLIRPVFKINSVHIFVIVVKFNYNTNNTVLGFSKLVRI